MHIAMDMGTSNTRLWLCDKDKVLESAKAAFGAGSSKTMGKDGLFSALKEQIDALLRISHLTPDDISYILTAGMAGSELALVDVPHIPIPADVYTLADSLQVHSIPEITTIPFLFVPGLKKIKGDALEDIMRGEETETAGIMPDTDCVLVLPGTHNKVIRVQKDAITDFYTTFSGELLSHIINHSILAGSVCHDFDLQERHLLHGASYARENGLNAALFHIRVMSKNGADHSVLSSFLYGAVLGQDAERIIRFAAGNPIFIGGRANLKAAYHILLADHASVLDDNCAANAVRDGLLKISRLYHTRQQRPEILQCIEEEKLIAIVRDPDEQTMLPALQALRRGGIRLVELTFDRSGKTPKAHTANLIRLVRENTDFLVGAGTVTSKEEVLLAFEAGAGFIISPNCDPEIIRLTKRLGMVSIPAGFTPTEIACAMHAGADYVKLFPADQAGPGYVKAVTAPLSDARLLAVGGVDASNAADFLRKGFAGVGVGSNLYNKALITEHNWQALETLAKEYSEAVSSIKA